MSRLILDTNGVGAEQMPDDVASIVFVETSAQYRRLAGKASDRSAVNAFTSQAVIYTSSTVWREFQRTLLAARELVVLGLLDVPPEERDFARALDRLADLVEWLADQTWSTREKDRALRTVEDIVRRIADDDQMTVSELLSYLQHETNMLREKFFRFGSHPNVFDVREHETYIDLADCAVARNPLDPGAVAPARITCRGDRRRCNVRQLLSGQLTYLETIGDALARTDAPAHRAIGKLLGESRSLTSVTDTRRALGQQRCWPIGDVIIALECPTDATLLSYDKHYEHICDVLGKSWHRLVPIAFRSGASASH
jgi:hypothetical protein